MIRKFFRLFADLRFSIFILLLISFCSIIGTIIEQDQPIEFYKLNYPLNNNFFSLFSWNFILNFGFDHIYRVWWFLTLLFFFGLSLILCSFFQQLPSLKIARRCQFLRMTNQYYNLQFFTNLKSFYYPKLLYRLWSTNYSIFYQRNTIYCYKGLIGRIAPLIVHFSMILILLGTIVGALFGFKAQEIVPKTESFHIQNILQSGRLTIVPKTSGRINDFWITYTNQGTVSQFYSDLSIFDSRGQEMERQTISVNFPLISKKVYYYQTDWNLFGVRIDNVKGQRLEYPLINILNKESKVWLTWISMNNDFKQGFIIILDNLEGYCSLYNEKGELIGDMELYETLAFTQTFTLIDIIGATGLQIKMDPGIPIIYLGFFFLMISTLLSYVTYSQIWVIKENETLFVGGNTNRAKFEFELEFLKLVN